LARPDRLPVAALGDGGALMGISELETAVRLGLPLVVVVYDDLGYGAEVHHFGPDGFELGTVRFPDTDIAAIGRGFGCTGVTVRGADDLAPVVDWLAGPRDAPIVIDAKVTADTGSWWLEEAFRGGGPVPAGRRWPSGRAPGDPARPRPGVTRPRRWPGRSARRAGRRGSTH